MKFGVGNSRTELAVNFTEYLDGLYSYAFVLSRNQAEAQDLVQETCLRALRAMGRLRPDSNVKSWLFTILRNIWLNQLRQRKPVLDVVDLDSNDYGLDQAAGSSKDPHEAYVSDVEREQVQRAIEQLPVEFREVILLREYEELSYEEIAAMLQCPVGTVMSRLARARSKLRDLLVSAMIALPGRKSANDAKDTQAQIAKPGGIDDTLQPTMRDLGEKR
jgi:RNA polymerase sigma-70 factor, ECF subfamily